MNAAMAALDHVSLLYTLSVLTLRKPTVVDSTNPAQNDTEPRFLRVAKQREAKRPSQVVGRS